MPGHALTRQPQTPPTPPHPHARPNHPGLTQAGPTQARSTWVLRALLAAGLMVAIAPLPGVAVAQVSEIAPARTAPDASAYRDQIKRFYQNQVQQIQSGDSTAQSAARSVVVGQLIGSGPSFRIESARAFSQAAAPILAQEEGFPAQVNLGIIAATLADQNNAAEMVPAVEALLRSNNEAVTLWGVKAAAPLVATLPGTARDEVVAKVIAAVERFPSGAVAAEAYKTLKTDATIASMIDVLEKRLARYQQGMPEEPSSELDAMNFVIDNARWATLPDDQKIRVTSALARLVLVTLENAVTAQPTEIVAMRGHARLAAAGVSVIAPNPASRQLATQIYNEANAAPPASVRDTARRLMDEIRKVPGYEELQPLPVSPAGAATSAAGASAVR